MWHFGFEHVQTMALGIELGSVFLSRQSHLHPVTSDQCTVQEHLRDVSDYQPKQLIALNTSDSHEREGTLF